MGDVTVVIPFKNGGNEEWLKRAIGSLPVGTKYLLARNDGELAEALNGAIEAAETEFVFRLDADDFIEEGTLSFLHSLAWDVDITYPSLVLCFETEQPFEFRKAAPFCPHRLQITNYVPGGSLMRRQAVLDVGGYREMPVFEDWDLWVRMLRAGNKFKAVPEARYWYRQYPTSRNKVHNDEEAQAVIARYRKKIVGEELDLKATFYHQASYPQTYLRCLLPARYLPGQSGDFLNIRLKSEDTLDFIDHRGAAVWQFPADGARAVQMAEMQDQGIRVLVEVDDDYLSTISATHQSEWGKKLGDQKHTLEAHRKIVPWVDGVVVTTEELAKRYRKVNPNVYVCPNQVDPIDWLETDKRDDGVLRIGWFASTTHGKDIKLVTRALEWASRQDGVEVLTMGLDPKWRFRRTHYPWSNDMGVYRKILGLLDIGLAPVVPDPWSSCRSDVKTLDHAMVGAYPLMSDEPPYREYEGPGEKLKTAKEYLNCLKSLVARRDEIRALGAEAREYVLRERTVEKNLWRWEAAIDG